MFDYLRNVTCIGLVIGVLGWLIWSKSSQPVSPPPGYLLQSPISEVNLTEAEVTALIQSINRRCDAVRTYRCDEIKITMHERSLLKLTADLSYEKDRRLRMHVKSVVGKELDIGSNDTHFWFWSKRMDPPALYYARHEQLNQTRLKTPFHPIWIKSTLGFDSLEGSNFVAVKRGDNWELLQQTKNVQGKPVLRSTIIDPKKLSMIGHYIYENGRLTVSSEVFEDKLIDGYYVATKVVVRWYDEDITLVWDLKNPHLNSALDPMAWEMPDTKRVVDMTTD